MEHFELRNHLTASLAKLYDMEAFSCLADFLQGELHVLHYLSQNSDLEINPSNLSDKLNVSRPRITAALSTLRKKGYVTMEMSTEDRRRVSVVLTRDGESFIKEKQDNVERYFDVLVKGLGEANGLDLIRLIELSIEIMDKGEKHL
ncbi:MarR family winged helix-turn-helix transcriptional regulator [Paenibacillus glacialis]|uniref:Transcriptional regulator n=1 Tax=Paenibacillus glacialis TaxID=494026 RepID=A0A168FB28_9BACL|nr:transcriptional regulator [Paenibacillus glacialis]OAB36034.1 transcriptional regulator [Paenibacillus glacialis]